MLLRTVAVTAVLFTGSLQARAGPPPAPGAWVLTVETTGGFVGRTSSVTITSDGQVTCRPAACTKSLTGEQLEALVKAVGSLKPEDWGPPQRGPFGTCHDCQRTTVTLARREEEGIHTDTAAWGGLDRPAPALSEVVRLIREVGSSVR